MSPRCSRRHDETRCKGDVVTLISKRISVVLLGMENHHNKGGGGGGSSGGGSGGHSTDNVNAMSFWKKNSKTVPGRWVFS